MAEPPPAPAAPQAPPAQMPPVPPVPPAPLASPVPPVQGKDWVAQQMAKLCADHTANTLLTVSRELTPNGVAEAFRTIEAQAAGIEQFAIHGSLDE